MISATNDIDSTFNDLVFTVAQDSVISIIKKHFSNTSDEQVFAIINSFERLVKSLTALVNTLYAIYEPSHTYKDIIVEVLSKYKHYISLCDPIVYNDWCKTLCTNFENHSNQKIKEHFSAPDFSVNVKRIFNISIDLKAGMKDFIEAFSKVVDIVEGMNENILNMIKVNLINMMANGFNSAPNIS